MPKPSNLRAKRLTSIRAGSLEEQRDTFRDDVYIDPNRYFRMSGNFGLGRDPWERLSRAAPQVLEGITSIAQDRATRRRTRGMAGPNPDAPMETMIGGMFPPTHPTERVTASGRNKKEAKRKRY